MKLPLIVGASELAAVLPPQSGVSTYRRRGDKEPARATRWRPIDLRSTDAFQAGHLPGAVRLEPALLNRAEPPFNGLLPSPGIARRLAEAIDLREGDHVIAYDAGRGTEAARLVWVLQVYGFTATSWLDGGHAAWVASGGEIATGDEAPPIGGAGGNGGPVELAQGTHWIIEADELLGELGAPDLRILDVRSAAEYAGTDVRSAMGGHVPGAIQLEWTTQLAPDGCLRPREELLSELAAIDVRPEHRVVVYCQTHQRSSVTWLILRHLGYEDVRGLDGAWSVWGNRSDLPKETVV